MKAKKSSLIFSFSVLSLILLVNLGFPQNETTSEFTALDIKQIDISKYPTISVQVEFINQDGLKLIPSKDVRIEVYEDEIKFPSTFTTEGEVYTSFLIDSSGSMKGKMDEVTQAISKYVFRMNKQRGDKAAIMSFNSWQEGIKIEQDFSDDEGKLLEAVKEVKTRGQTALYEAIRDASTHFYPEYYSPMKIIIILTDGGDTQSTLTWFQSVEFAKEKGIKIFCLAMGAKADVEDLSKICTSTGGEVFYTKNPEELPIVYTKIAQRVKSNICKVTYKTDVEKPKGKPQHVQIFAYKDNELWCKSLPIAYKMRY
ncbi:VWA domain-containing protein [bacterium]|nr:VWA domain-containing protein [bacterium]